MEKKIELGHVINATIDNEGDSLELLFIPEKSGSYEVNGKSSIQINVELLSINSKSVLSCSYSADEIHLASTLLSSQSYLIKFYSQKQGGNKVEIMLEVTRLFEPSVRNFRYQWGLLNKDTGLDINIVPVWKQMQCNHSLKIGIADTGIDYSLIDLEGNVNIDLGYNFVHNMKEVWYLDEANTKSASKSGHSNHIAGVIGARQDRFNGIMGIVPNPQLVSLKILGSPIEEHGAFNEATESFIQAIEYARRNHIRIMNCSFSGLYSSEKERQAILDAKDILFIMAAGNEGINLEMEPRYPACYDTENSIVVAAVDKDGKLYPTSNYGGPTDITAPGDRILSLFQDNQYIVANGTSVAAPFVTGVCSLLMTERKDLSPADIKKIVVSEDNVTKIGCLKNLVRSGGMINAYKALACSKQIET